MKEKTKIPNSVIGSVAEILGDYYYSHTKLNALFMESGAPGDPPPGNCVTKCMTWLKRCNEDSSVEPLSVLGAVIQDFMDKDLSDEWGDDRWSNEQTRIRRALAKNGLTYQLNGQVLTAGSSPSSRTLSEILHEGDLAAVDIEFQRALASLESDPPAGLTAASALIEALCKAYIEDQGLTMPTRQTIKELWRVVRVDLGLDPRSTAEDDVRRILSGLASIVDGVGSLRTHAGSAHGRGPTSTPVTSREARLAIHAAHTLAVFLIEVWQDRQGNKTSSA